MTINTKFIYYIIVIFYAATGSFLSLPAETVPEKNTDDSKHPIRLHTVQKRDVYGRKYEERWDGRILFKIDSEYTEYPSAESQPEIHLEEAYSLFEKKKNVSALRILKGMELCFRNQTEDAKKRNMPLLHKTVELKNRILSLSEDRKEELNSESDPYLCRMQDYHILESEEYGLRMKIPLQLSPRTGMQFISRGKWHNYKIMYFTAEDQIQKDFSMEEWLNFLSKKKPYPLNKRIVLSLNFSRHRSDRVTETFLKNFWENERGLNDRQKSILKYVSEKRENAVYSEFFRNDNDGKFRKYSLYHTYRVSRNDRGVSVFLSAPEEREETVRIFWKTVFDSVSMKN
ncbi:MAG TPA: hypothetical protein PL048_00215 [Leptospiraceae bacterium]|nr:hypothetical protein [Leptospiraceae bacterium]HNI24799.1 hypothetical protein [Leptospiraceae bacterium]